MAKRSARTAAWSMLLGLVAARFVNEVAPVAVQTLVGVGVAVGTDWFLRWRAGARQRDEAAALDRAAQERDDRLGRGR